MITKSDLEFFDRLIESEEEDDDSVYESDAFKSVTSQHDSSEKALSYLESMANDDGFPFGKHKKFEYVELIQKKFPDVFWADEIVDDNFARLAQHNRNLRIEKRKREEI